MAQNYDINYVINLRGKYGQQLADMTKRTEKLEKELQRVQKASKGAGGAAKGFGGELKNIANQAGVGLTILQIVSFLKDFTIQSWHASTQMKAFERAILASAKSAGTGYYQIQQLDDTIYRLGLNAEATRKGFKTFQGSMQGMNLSASEQNRIFEQLSTGITAMGLSAEQSEGAYLALGQMMSKGKVQAEELRGQLAERIPGAFQLAADAMGVTTAELNKMLEQGEVVASEFLPKFAAEMERAFGADAQRMLESNTAKTNRLMSAYGELKNQFGGGLQRLIFGRDVDEFATNMDRLSFGQGFTGGASNPLNFAFGSLVGESIDRAFSTLNRDLGYTKTQLDAVIDQFGSDRILFFSQTLNSASQNLERMNGNAQKLSYLEGLLKKLQEVDPPANKWHEWAASIDIVRRKIAQLNQETTKDLSKSGDAAQEAMERFLIPSYEISKKATRERLNAMRDLEESTVGKMIDVPGAGGQQISRSQLLSNIRTLENRLKQGGSGGPSGSGFGGVTLASRAPKNFNITIDTLAEITFESYKAGTSPSDIQRQVAMALATALNDVQISSGS